ncbi:hypothetical protein ACH4VR_19925 [Streptomyces sp. NPDC020883]|uniref:hypothetical protein n=1 Tax=Streptomyces sp. NPDC020883 TaxID=3365099 RepID=UPI0037A9847D
MTTSIRHPQDVILCRRCKAPEHEHNTTGHRFTMYVSRPTNWRISVSWERRIGSAIYRFELVPARNRPGRNGGELIVTRHTPTDVPQTIHQFRIRATRDYMALLEQTGRINTRYSGR